MHSSKTPSIFVGHTADGLELAPLIDRSGHGQILPDGQFCQGGQVAVGTAIAIGLHPGCFPDQVVAVIPTKAAPGLSAVPEMAQTAIAGLLRGIHFLLHIQTSNLYYFSGKVPEMKKERLLIPEMGANKRSM